MIGVLLFRYQGPSKMNELLRCPHCHRWSDALLVWAAGDCCPSCNGEMSAIQRDRVPLAHSERVRSATSLTARSHTHRRHEQRLSGSL